VSETTIDLLRDLIAIDSVNPSLAPNASGEAEIAAVIASTLRKGGVHVEVQPVTGSRSNVIGLLEGAQHGRTLMLCGHMDTVGVGGMDAPFDPVQKGNRVYGRGSQDMKGGLAAMLSACLQPSSMRNTPALAPRRWLRSGARMLQLSESRPI
jgi:acetylornithine deacetylase